MLIYILSTIALAVAGHYVGREVYLRRNRNPQTGAFLGAMAALFFHIPGLLIFAGIAFLLPSAPAEPLIQETRARQDEFVPRPDTRTPGSYVIEYPDTPRADDGLARIKEAHALLEEGVIDEREFREIKRRIISEG
jgi:hypothetical protein